MKVTGPSATVNHGLASSIATAVTVGRAKAVVRDGKAWLDGDCARSAENQAILKSVRDVIAARGPQMDVESLAWTEVGSITPDQFLDRSPVPA